MKLTYFLSTLLFTAFAAQAAYADPHGIQLSCTSTDGSYTQVQAIIVPLPAPTMTEIHQWRYDFGKVLTDISLTNAISGKTMAHDDVVSYLKKDFNDSSTALPGASVAFEMASLSTFLFLPADFANGANLDTTDQQWNITAKNIPALITTYNDDVMDDEDITASLVPLNCSLTTDYSWHAPLAQ